MFSLGAPLVCLLYQKITILLSIYNKFIFPRAAALFYALSVTALKIRQTACQQGNGRTKK